MAGFISGIIEFDAMSYSTTLGNNNDVSITGTRFLVSTTTDLDAFTGFMAGATHDGMVFIINVHATNRLVLKYNNSGSISGNRIFTATGGDLLLLPGQLAIIGEQQGVGWFVFDVVGRRVETYSGTTNVSGVYTVVFPIAYTTTPDIQASILNQSNVNQYLRITSVSTTGFTINIFQRNSVNILGIDVLLSTTVNVNGASIGVLITEK